MDTDDRTPAAVGDRHHVVILGAGFGGLACAQALGGSRARVTVVDRRNHHLFVPLLYQVATAALSPADIAEPVRSILRRHRNIDVVMAEVTGIDVDARRVRLSDGGHLGFDRLVVATGSVPSYFGHDDWAAAAPGLKSIEDARRIRTGLLSCFEQAETCTDPARQAALMTTVVIGGGPTGVEMAGAVAELARFTLARDFRRIDPRAARVLLVEAGPRLLSTFPEDLAAYARDRLERLGVEIRTDQPVRGIAGDGVAVGADFVPAGTVVWAAGVAASPAAHWLGVESDRLGRIRVAADLSVPGRPGIHALGDTVLALGEDGAPLPGLAQVATQQGRHLGRHLALALEAGDPADAPLPPFRFRNRGNTAIIGRNAAVFDFGRRRLKGRLAWLLWAVVHIYLLVGFEKRARVSLQWLWRYATYRRGARLITGDSASAVPEAPPIAQPRNRPAPGRTSA